MSWTATVDGGRTWPRGLRPRPGRHRLSVATAGRRLVALVLALPLLVVVASLAPPPASAQAADTPPVLDDPERLIPDLTLLVEGAAAAELSAETSSQLAADLAEVDGVFGVRVDPGARDQGQSVLLVHLQLDDAPGQARPLATVVEEVEGRLASELPGVSVVAGGRAVIDDDLVGRLAAAAWALVLVALIVGAVLGVVFGWGRGALAAFGLAAAVAFAGLVGQRVAGEFDGTMAGSALPAALAGLVAGVALVVRLLVWFRHPRGDDGAEVIRAAISDIGLELALVLSGLIATAVVVDLLDPGRSALSVAVAGMAVALAVVVAIVIPGLTVLGADRPGPRADLVPVPFPALGVGLLVIVFSLLLLAVLSIAASGRLGGPLLGSDQFDDDSEVGRVAEVVAGRGGDPTWAMVAIDEGADDARFVEWSQEVAGRSEVGWVDLGTERITSLGVSSQPDWLLLSDPDRRDLAVVVLSVDPRSVEGQALVERLPALSDTDGGPRLVGHPAITAELAGSRLALWIAILGLAATSALAVVVLTGNRALGLVSFALRILAGGAVVGIHNLVVGDPVLAPALTTLAVVGIGSILSELELVRRVDIDGEPGAWDPQDPGARYRAPVPSDPGALDGQYGILGLATLVPAGLVVAVVGSLVDSSRTISLGIGLVAAALVEVLVAAIVLRPSLLGQGSLFQTLSRPVRVLIHGRQTGPVVETTEVDDDPGWTEVVSDLLDTEFRLQNDPNSADLDLVFTPGTPVHAQASERRQELLAAQLRVAGRRPRLHSLQTVRDHLPVVVVVAVDHPERQLLDRDGDIVGVRAAERRFGRIWLAPDAVGRYRIAESVELGAALLDGDEPVDGDEAVVSSPA